MKRLPRLALPLLLTFLTLAGFPAWGQDRFSARVLEVLHGDEIRVRLDNLDVTVHLHGVESPITSVVLEERALQYTARRVADTMVRVDVKGTGPRKMIYGEVYPITGGSLNEELIRVGIATWAQAYAPNRTDLAQIEKEAQAAKRGLWSDTSGRNVPLPPSSAEIARKQKREEGNRQQAKAKRQEEERKRQESLKPSPTPNTPVARTAVDPTPSETDHGSRTTSPPLLTWGQRLQLIRYYLRSAYAPPAPEQAFRPLWLPLILGFAAIAGGAFVFFLGAGSGKRGVFFPLLCALFIGASGAALLPLPLLLFSHYLPYTRDSAVIALALILGVFLWRKGVALCRLDQLLRATPRYRIADAPLGFVRVSGAALASQGVVHSITGRIPTLYFREVTHCYQPQTDGKYDRVRNSLPHRWELIRDETEAADFLIEDESGAALASAARAEFYPLRVARFYNEIAVEAFPTPPYSGDTRTQIYFLPEGANVTIWGRRYRSSSLNPDETSERIGYDSITDCLIVVEENPSRLYTRRPLIGLLLVIFAVALFGLAAYCLLTPRDLPPLRITIAQFVLDFWKGIGR